MPQQHASSPDQGERFDWWAGRSAGSPRPAPKARSGRRRSGPRAGVPTVPVVAPPAVPAAATVPAPAAVPTGVAAARPAPAGPTPADAAEVYRAVQGSEAFQEIRRGYRAFVFPATGVFLGWYLLYVGAQAAAPVLMRRQVVGPLNVAWVLGLLQFASTFLLTWLYARNARTRRDRAALELRWTTQDRLR